MNGATSSRCSRVVLLAALAGSLSLLAASAPSAIAADSCPNAAVRAQQGATRLPGCRAYELVNPATDDVGETNRVMAISNDGNHAAYMSVIPGDTALGGAVTSTVLASRTASGWTSADANLSSLGPAVNNTENAAPIAFSRDFSTELMFTNVPGVPDDHRPGLDAYRVNVGTGTGTWMSRQVDGFLEQLFGGTPDLSSILVRLAPGSATPGLFKTDGSTMELLSVDESGTPFGDALPAGGRYQRGYLTGATRTQDPWVEHGGGHGASDDATRIYFNDTAPGGGRLYVRDLRDNPAVTYTVSKSQRAGDVGTIYPGQFISATHDGSVAYFASPAQLTDAATVGGGIYRFTLADRSLTLVTPDVGDPGGLNLAGAIASDDQSHIYFTSTTVLAGSAVAGDENAYVWTQADGVRFLGAVNAGDQFVRASRNGRYALMVTTASIAGATNNGHSAVFEYDDASHQVRCVSCRPDGTPSAADAVLEDQPPNTFPVGGIAGGMTHPRSLTDDGQVVFVSRDRLVPEDQTGAGDVYLYDKGSVSLLTSGQGDENSFVAENSDDGKNIFVVTRSALVSADRDPEEFDVYDVRVDGGFLEPPAPSDPCHGDDCQRPPAPPLGGTSPESTHVDSSGDVAPERVAKRLSMARLTSTQRRSLARTGKVTLRVRVVGGGTVTVRGRGSIGGKTKTLGTGRTTVLKRKPATVRVTFKLSHSARKQLSKRHRLRITLDVGLSGVAKHVKTTANLTRAAH